MHHHITSHHITILYNVQDPVIQDFGSMADWSASKTGLGRLGDDKIGDDYSNEGYGR